MLHKHWAVFKHWQTVSSVRVLLQRQGRAVAGSLQALRLRQAWQLWRRNHRQALAAQQRKYIRMVHDLLKVIHQDPACMPPSPSMIRILWLRTDVIAALHMTCVNGPRHT